MKKTELLQEILELKDELTYFKDQDKEIKGLKRTVLLLERQIATMSDAKTLLDDNLKTHRAREKIAGNHNAIMDALFHVNKGYKRLFIDFMPLLEKLQEDVITLSDEFTIPIDTEKYPHFIDGKDARVKAYEERKKAKFDYQVAQIERKPPEEIEEARRNLNRLIEEASK
ncbi:MAG: hypothetical protein NTY39_09365 [Campylobacterales bacterium]|nr:hypothetical protein [Campylobacterales bacterium]